MSEPVRQRESAVGEEMTEPQKNGVVDIVSLMNDIRERVRRDVEQNRTTKGTLSPVRANFSGDTARRAGDLQHSEDLRFLNLNYAFESAISAGNVATHRRGIFGRIVVALKRRFVGWLREAVLGDYLRAERQFVEHLVRYLNESGRYIDARDGAIFAELVRKIDVDVSRVFERVSRVDEEKTSHVVGLENQLVAASSDLINRIESVDTMVRGLEGIVNNLPTYTDSAPPRAEEAPRERAARPDLSYLLLENRYRGGEAEIAQRLGLYVELFRGADGEVLEIGSGRGELQRLFKEREIKSYGVDLDTVMVNVANSYGCDTRYGDGIAHLRTLPDRSLAGLVATQVVEHLTHSQIQELCELAKAKLKKGARIAFETINPQSLLALSSNYFRDPTHVWPMHPDTLGYIATLTGLRIVEVRYLSPVAKSHLLKEIPIDSTYAPVLADALTRLNGDIKQLNDLLYGYQDYALILEVL